ncbi:MAG: RbsD/FucU domain-containing protein [Ancalomicrobiaceae bacterium]|nr:RbsD/FucU domain-containing protein [Ancalomicrobiaceae bacterium]
MLIGLDPLLDPELLYALRQMGHGDELIVVDTNYPAVSTARKTVVGHPIRLTGVPAPRAIEAVLSVMPLDDFVEDAVFRMEVAGDPAAIPPVQVEVQGVVDKALGRHQPMAGIERHAFYARAATSFAVLVTGETRVYGCFILKKGIVRPA